MKILWVKAGKLLPIDTGGKIRSYNILSRLFIQHELTLLTFYGGRRDRSYESEITRHFAGAVTIHTAAPDTSSLGRALHYLRRLPSQAPFAVTKFTAKPVQRTMQKWFDDQRFQIAVCDFLSASLNFPEVLTTPTVLFEHNVESALWRRQAEWESNWVKKLAFKLEAIKMHHYERKALRKFHHIIAVSQQDLALLKAHVEASRITVVPTGVDLQKYNAAKGTTTAGSLVVFVGSMDWEANIDAVEYFCHDIWPRVRAAIPAARFRIVGRNPSSRVRKLASDSVEVTGTVTSVVEHLAEAGVVVVPLRIGGGTRLKIYESMAMRKAIVSTTIGAEGLDVHHGRDILLADDPLSFADALTALLRDPSLRQKYGDAASDIASQYDWSGIAERFARVLEEVVKAQAEKANNAIPNAPVALPTI